MELVLGYGAGLLTLINPCVLPVLPIVLASALQAHRLGPVALALGMSVAFVVLGLTVAAAGRSLGLSEDTLASAGAAVMVIFGTVLLVPRLNAGFATATGGLAMQADAGIDRLQGNGLGRQAAAGALLGAVWSPCIGPTLGGAIALASQGESLVRAAGVMTAFAAGVSTVILALGYGARAALQRRRALMRSLAAGAKPVMGVALILVGVMILTRTHHRIEIWLLDVLPPWLMDLSVAL
jgi:cytochrome c biogenesis protein CcdA